MLAVLFYLACVGLFFTLSLLGPILVGLLANENAEAVRLGFYVLVGGFVFGTPILAMLGRLRRIPQIGRLMLMFLVWTVLPFAAALPFYHMMEISLSTPCLRAFRRSQPPGRQPPTASANGRNRCCSGGFCCSGLAVI